ncbi:hypothetical protein [Micromonospora cremea]|uniref:Uncharacterized protein n=1 Tax=Micromonospora cremea TaxID=709881 RepID=A0A1N5UEG5_9ACTN|nr:hypothetical protein [Micromonospora cremea]SIM58518.1 hypothetical protein SAMN04489832_0806 [Micromonospora cremea]
MRRALRLAAAVAAALVLVTALWIRQSQRRAEQCALVADKVLYRERAEVRDIEGIIARARAAVVARWFEEAQQLIDQAQQDLTRITGPAEVDRLRADIDAVLDDLTAQAGCPTWPGARPSRLPRRRRRSPRRSVASRQPAAGRRRVAAASSRTFPLIHVLVQPLAAGARASPAPAASAVALGIDAAAHWRSARPDRLRAIRLAYAGSDGPSACGSAGRAGSAADMNGANAGRSGSPS